MLLAPAEPPKDQKEGTKSGDMITDLDCIISQLEGLQERVTGLKRVADVRRQRNREVSRSQVRSRTQGTGVAGHDTGGIQRSLLVATIEGCFHVTDPESR